MKILILVVLLLAVAAWIGATAGHWMDKKAAPINRPYLEEISR